MRQKFFAIVMALAVSAYVLLAFGQAYLFAQNGGAMGAALGISIAVIGLLGLFFIAREVRFGLTMQAMGRTLAATGELPEDSVPRLPSGRAEVGAADARWLEAREACEQDPSNWTLWYRLALAYDDARDRKRARASMREAARLFKAGSSPKGS